MLSISVAPLGLNNLVGGSTRRRIVVHSSYSLACSLERTEDNQRDPRRGRESSRLAHFLSREAS